MTERFKIPVADLEAYLASLGVGITDGALDLFREVERSGEGIDAIVSTWLFMAVLVRRVDSLRRVLAKRGTDPDVFADALTRMILDFRRSRSMDPYDTDPDYTRATHRITNERARAVDLAIINAQRQRRTTLTPLDLIAAVLASHDEAFPGLSTGGYSDERMRTPWPTLCHMLGEHDSRFAVRLEDIRRDLGLPNWPIDKRFSEELTPPEVSSSLKAFNEDHPDYSRNCFLIMPFAQTKIHTSILEAIRGSCRATVILTPSRH